MSLAWLPNAICVFRMLLVVPVAIALVRGEYALTLLLFGVAAVSDGADGWLAKTFGWTSELGKILDPLADKLLLVTTFVTLAALGLAPVWLAAAAVTRDLVIAGGAIAYQLLYGSPHGQPTRVSKANTLLQLAFVLAVVAAAAWHRVPDALLVPLGALTFVTTVVSGLDYVLTYSRKAVDASRARARAV